MTDARALAGRSGMPVRAAVGDGVPVGKKPQTGIEVKKSVGLAVHANNSQRRRSQASGGKIFARRFAAGPQPGKHPNNFFYLAAWPQQEPEVKNKNKKKRQAFYRDA
jgi:hypothetical protein